MTSHSNRSANVKHRKENAMKLTVTLALILALSAPSFALAQSDGMKDVGMKDMDMQKCMDMKGANDMKGMDMKGQDSGKGAPRP